MKIMVQVFVALAVAVLLSGWMVPVARATATTHPACGGITGKIIGAYNKQPIVGAVVIYLYAKTAQSRNVPPAPMIFHTKTKANGQFTVNRIPLGTYRIAVRFKMRYGGGEGQSRRLVKVTASPACVNVGTIECAVFMQ